jgi:hypothetical protein
MNCIIYVPFKGSTLFWEYRASDVDGVREIIQEKFNIKSRPWEFDGIYQMYCRDECEYPLFAEEEDEDV